jgi:co-chaperonin GroES (HSP10)
MINTSGIAPLDMRVLVCPETIGEKIGSIFIPETAQEREKYAKIEATLVAVGANAWADARSEAFTPPKPGDKVLIAKYGGILHTGRDGKDYRILNDADIIGVTIDD